MHQRVRRFGSLNDDVSLPVVGDSAHHATVAIGGCVGSLEGEAAIDHAGEFRVAAQEHGGVGVAFQEALEICGIGLAQNANVHRFALRVRKDERVQERKGKGPLWRLPEGGDGHRSTGN